VRTAAEAVRFNASEFGLSKEASTASIERTVRDAREHGETITPWWFENCRYKLVHQTHGSGEPQPDRCAAEDAKARKDRIVKHLEFCSRELKEKSAAVIGLQTIAEELEELRDHLHGSASGYEEAEIDARLTAMEERMFSQLESAADQDRVTEIQKEARAQVGKRRSEMNAQHQREIERQVLFKRLLETFDLPRLSLFYIDSN
jgi:hypothetical protein